MKSVADQSVAELGGRFSVLARQKNDHVTLNRLLERLGATPPDEQDVILLDIYRLVFPHAFAEESVLWPVMRRTLPDGEELTLQVEREHQEVNELVTRLEHLDAFTADRQPALNRLVDVLREDVRDEEDELFPRLQTRISVAHLRLLGLAWEVVRRIAPTRAHPVVARRPPGNVVAALPLSILDRTRDRIDMLIHRGAGRLDGPLRSANAVLTRAAHAVERLPIMRRGEDPSTRIAPKPNAVGMTPAGAWAEAPIRRITMTRTSRLNAIVSAAGIGAAAGLVGAGVMVIGEKVEQALTHRPDSYVPARALLSLLGQRPSDDARPPLWNHLMHWGTGAAVGTLRGVWAVIGIRGPQANAWHTVVRLAFDQTIENGTGVGAPPSSWPVGEKIVDVGHKAVYSVVTGMIADRFLSPTLASTRGRTSH